MTKDDDIVAAQVVDQLRKIAERWGIDYRTGRTLDELKMPSADDARVDVVTLIAIVVAHSRQRWPSKLFDEFVIDPEPN